MVGWITCWCVLPAVGLATLDVRGYLFVALMIKAKA